MRLGLLSGCIGIHSDDENMPGLLKDAAERFIRAGGSVTLAEWAGMSEDERQALVGANAAVHGFDSVRSALDEAVTS